MREICITGEIERKREREKEGLALLGFLGQSPQRVNALSNCADNYFSVISAQLYVLKCIMSSALVCLFVGLFLRVCTWWHH